METDSPNSSLPTTTPNRRTFSNYPRPSNTRSKRCLVCGITFVSPWHGLCGNEHPFIPEELRGTVRKKQPSTLVGHQSASSFTDYNQRPEEHQKALWGRQHNSQISHRCNMLVLNHLIKWEGYQKANDQPLRAGCLTFLNRGEKGRE